VQAIGRQPQQAPDGAAVDRRSQRPGADRVHDLVQQHAASFITQTEASNGSALPRLIKEGPTAARAMTPA
jgi:hypothetical protein